MTPLSPSERRFVAEYLKDQKGGPAAIRAGYSKRSADQIASRLLRKDKVRAAIDTSLVRATEAAEIQVTDVLKTLAQLASVDIRKAFNTDGTLKSIHEMPDDIAAAISSIEVDDGRGEIKKVKLWDKTKALEMIGKHLKMFVDRTELTDGAGAPVIIQMVSAEYDAAKNNQSPDDKGL